MNLHGTILRGIGINALLFPTVTAFLEVDHNGTIAENTFVDKSLHQVDETVFLRGRDAIPDDAKAKLSRLEERLGGVKPGNTHLDARSGRVASIELRQPLLPGSGDGNTLLWSVGFVGDDTEVRSSLTDEEWSNLGVQAVKVILVRLEILQHWICKPTIHTIMPMLIAFYLLLFSGLVDLSLRRSQHRCH